MQQVQDWLSGSRNFFTGRAIYKAFGTDNQLKELIDKGQTTYSMQQLLLGMESLVSTTSKKEAEKFEESTSVIQHKSGLMPEGSDLVLKAIKAEWLPFYKKMQYHISQLDKYGDRNDEEAIEYRKPIAAEILELEERINKIWKKREHYIEHGEILTDKKKTFIIPKSPLKLASLINCIKRNIRYNRTMMRKHPTKQLYSKKYLSYKLQYQQVTGKQYQEVDNE